MPYIPQSERGQAATDLDHPGKLNYVITRLILRYIEIKGMNYRTVAEITGVLENVKQEFYRRRVANYEEEKRKINGDVYCPQSRSG